MNLRVIEPQDGLSTTCRRSSPQIFNVNETPQPEQLVTALSGFCYHSVSVQNVQELQGLIQHASREVLHFDSMSIFLIEEQGNSIMSYLIYARDGNKVDPEFIRVKETLYPFKDGFFDVTLENNLPIIWDLNEVSKWENIPERVQMCIENGISVIVGVSVGDNIRKIGNVFWGYKNASAVSEQEIALAWQVGAYIGRAIANVNLIENNQKKLREKEALLELTAALFAAKDKTSLVYTLNLLLKPLVGFNGLMFVLNDTHEEALNPYLLYFEQNNTLEPDASFDPRQMRSDLKILQNVFSSREPSSWAMTDLMKMPARPHFLTRYRVNNVKKVIGMPLSDNGNIKGALFLFSERPGAFLSGDSKLLKTVAPHIAKAIAHVLLLEEMAIKDKESEIILATSRIIMTVAGIEQVQQALRAVFASFTFFQEGFIHFFNSLPAAHKPIVFKQTSAEIFSEAGFAIDDPADENDPFLKSLKHIKEATLIDIDAYFHGVTLPPYVSIWQEGGIHCCIVIPFIDNGIVSGLFFFLSTDTATVFNRYFNLICSIARQISAAVNHAFTNERLTKQLHEIRQFRGQLEIQNTYLKEEIETTHNYSEIIGSSSKMRVVFHLVSQVAKTNSSVLILGETGTGKELIARAIHNLSLRKSKVMVKVNCAALPANLIESELFGHERGSFTGASDRRIGKFEMAHNSTIFLDEIGELPMALQVKLLRVLQEKEIERIGGRSTIKVDVRVVAASNRDLLKEVHRGNFRGDLYFRLNVFPIELPPLRERKEDIPVLANHFAEKYARKFSVSNVHFTSKVMKQMVAYNWPGNVRELEHLVERSVLVASGRIIREVYLAGSGLSGEELPLHNADVKTLAEIERDHIISVLKMVNGKISGVGGAAEMLKIPATSLASKIIKLKIKKDVV